MNVDKASVQEQEPGDEDPWHITCHGCGTIILTVPYRTAKAFASGAWLCSRQTCYERRTA